MNPLMKKVVLACMILSVATVGLVHEEENKMQERAGHEIILSSKTPTYYF